MGFEVLSRDGVDETLVFNGFGTAGVLVFFADELEGERA